MRQNDITVESYSQQPQNYLDSMPKVTSEPVKAWIDQVLALLPDQQGLCLELGTAAGQDANYIESRGFKIQRSDAVQAFVDRLEEQGHQARLLNAITDPLGGPYTMVFANAVFLHFSRDDLRRTLVNIHKSLVPGGILAFTVKKGKGEEWSSHRIDAPRYFLYWQEKDIKAMVEKAKFEVVDIHERRAENRPQDWLHVIARKKP